MSRQTRRAFLKTAAASAGVCTAFTIAGTKASGRVIGANDTIRIGVAGINGRGRNHISSYVGQDGVQVTYLIDPDSRLFNSRSESVKKRGGNTPTCVQDIREALADKNLDAVSIASCNHWHALLAIWSCQAGKDVYVEKPCSHNIFEGRKLVEAAAKYNCIVQHGTQQRSEAPRQKSIAAVGSGKYGKLLISYGYASKPRGSIKFQQPETPPTELDFNLWLGPAPEQDYHRNIVHYNWHWFWDFGNGEIGNQGVHQMDIARWGIPGGTLPKSVISMGGRWVNSTEGHPPFTDQGQTPNNQLTVCDYGETLLVFEVIGLGGNVPGSDKKYPTNVGNEFYLEEGAIKGGKFYPKGSDKAEALDVDFEPRSGNIFGNFIEAVRSRKREDLYADIREAHLSAAVCHLGNISYRLGKQVSGTEEPDVLDAHEEVRKSWTTIVDRVNDALGLDLSKSTYQLGPKLEFDAKTEKFVGNADADALLTRDYRKPFVVTEEV